MVGELRVSEWKGGLRVGCECLRVESQGLGHLSFILSETPPYIFNLSTVLPIFRTGPHL